MPDETKKKRKAIWMPCPRCGNGEVGISVRLDCLDGGDDAFECEQCSETFSISDIENLIAKWSKLLSWIDAAPDMEAD